MSHQADECGIRVSFQHYAILFKIINADGGHPGNPPFCYKPGRPYVFLQHLSKDGLPDRQGTHLKSS